MLIPFLHYQTGGMERQAWQLAQRLHSQNIEVFFITCVRFWEFFTKRLNLKINDHQEDIKIYRIPGIYPPFGNKLFPLEFLIGGLLLLILLFQKRIDVIHTHQLFSAGLVGALAKKIINKPLITKIASSGPDGDVADLKRYPFTKFKFKQLKKTDYFIAINPTVVDELMMSGFQREKIQEIPNGVNTDIFKPITLNKSQLKKRLNLPNKKIVTFIGRIVKQKQLHYLIDIWPKVLEKYPESHLIIIGKPDITSDYFDKIQQKIKDFKLATNISFLGTFPTIKDYLAASDIFVLPSRSEGLSNVLLEAVATGLPIIASRIPGNQIVIEDKKNGLLFDHNNPADLLNKIYYLLDHPLEADQLGKQARNLIEEKFSLRIITQKYIQLYKEIISE